jgi:hypothetical protein
MPISRFTDQAAIVAVLASSLGLALLCPATASADTVITQCTEPVLRNAISKGGTVTCACSGTITLTNNITIATNVVLDGTGQSVILSGGNAVRIVTVNTGVNLTLKTVTLSGGKHAGADGTNGVPAGNGGGGAIFNDGGNVTATNCTFSGNAAAGGNGANGVVQLNGRGGDGGAGGFGGGGAVYNFGGTVALTNCVFTGNTASAGTGGNGADGATGNNDAGRGGDGGTAAGGAIFNAAPGRVIVYDCTFASNRVTGAVAGMGGNGTGLGSNGSTGAPGTGDSGAIYNDGGTVIATFSTFSDNTATGGDGADGKAGAGDRNGTGGTSGAHAGGGAIFNNGGSLAVTNCTFYANTVRGGKGGAGGGGGTSGFGGNGGDGGAGGGGRGGGLYNAGNGTNTVVNCTFSSNGATGGSGGAGGVAGSGGARVGRNGSPGGSYGGGVSNGTGTLTLKNSIVTYSASGGEGAGVVTDGGNNLSFDASLALTAPSSRNNEDPGLGNPGNNGGATRTIPILVSTSFAVNGGDDAASLPVDQRHYARLGTSDMGAFEFNGFEPGAVLSIRRQINEVVLSWPTALSVYSLQSTPVLSPASWAGVTNARVISGNQYVVTNGVETNRFYRLIR